MKILLFAALGIILGTTAFGSTWLLDHSTLTYKVDHPLKKATGTSTEAKGKGHCEKDRCEFLIAAPVKSFDSGDSNRDLHMLEVTRGGTYPMVVVRSNFSESSIKQSKIPLDLNVEFAGKKALYKSVPFEVQMQGSGSAHLIGELTVLLSDFEVSPPSLLTLSIKNEVPIKVDAFWKRAEK